MSNDVIDAKAPLASTEQPERAVFIEACAPPSAPMAMPLQTLEVDWPARFRLAVLRPSLSGAVR